MHYGASLTGGELRVDQTSPLFVPPVETGLHFVYSCHSAVYATGLVKWTTALVSLLPTFPAEVYIQ